MLDPKKVWAAVMTDYFTSNETVLCRKEDKIRETSFIYGYQAEIIHDNEIDVIEKVGHPDEVFVTAPKLARLLNCTPETARKWLKRFQAHGILKQHGDTEIKGRVEFLYLPDLEDAADVFTVLDDLVDGSSGAESTNLTEVTPGDFRLTESKGIYRYREDPDITIDVRENRNTQSIQENIEKQLEQVGLIPSSSHNFSYQLRESAGLVGNSGSPENYRPSTCSIKLSNKESPIKGKSQAKAMSNFVDYIINEQDFLKTHSLPWAPGRGYRAIINDEPRHRNGEPMDDGNYQKISGGYFVFTKLNSEDKQEYIRIIAKEVGLKVEFSGGW